MASSDTRTSSLPALTLAALGIVYGDIGTSPLYALKEAFGGYHGAQQLAPEFVLATLSTLFWAVLLSISVKYVWLVLRYDNEGEGGVLALTAYAHRVAAGRPKILGLIASAGIFAGALFYGDAVITPAISVLSAVEGIKVAAPSFSHGIVPLTVIVIIGLFVVQKQGTGLVGKCFGPVTLLWFITLAVLGANSIAQTPAVLQALNPLYALAFASSNPHTAFVLLSAVFLALTGGEALYADMGHFGAKAVRIAWYGLVWPALVLNYFGQGALLLRDADAVANPFYLLAPDTLRLPLVGLATLATVIASQATISGAFSITAQAVHMGYLPRLRILHTSELERGQIYVPGVNALMLLAVVVVVLIFRSSGALAAAYGIAVSGTMIITTLLASVVVTLTKGRWRWLTLAGFGLFALLELGFLSSNLMKIFDGGWLPLAVGALAFTLLTTWKEGARMLAIKRREMDIPLDLFLNGPAPEAPRVSGTAVYLTSDLSLVPSALFHNLKHYKVMHETTVFLRVKTVDIPHVASGERLQLTPVGEHEWVAEAHFGFRDQPDVPAVLREASSAGLNLDPMQVSYFVARSLVVDGEGTMPRWRAGLFGWMTRQADSPANYFRLPPNAVVELGTQVVI